MKEAKKNYRIYDNNGDEYVVAVTDREALSLDLDANKVYRLLVKLKKSGEKPISRWHDSVAGNSTVETNLSAEWRPSHQRKKATAKSAAQSVPPHGRASGKTGADWPNDDSVHIFLRVCQQFSDELQCKQLPLKFWQKISDILYVSEKLDYSAEQLREKMRNLKRTYEAKKKLYSTSSIIANRWPFLEDMHKIFDGACGLLPTSCVSVPRGFETATQCITVDTLVIPLSESPLPSSRVSGRELFDTATQFKEPGGNVDALVTPPSESPLPSSSVSGLEFFDTATQLKEPGINVDALVTPPSESPLPSSSVSGLEFFDTATQFKELGISVDHVSPSETPPILPVARSLSLPKKSGDEVLRDANYNVELSVSGLEDAYDAGVSVLPELLDTTTKSGVLFRNSKSQASITKDDEQNDVIVGGSSDCLMVSDVHEDSNENSIQDLGVHQVSFAKFGEGTSRDAFLSFLSTSSKAPQGSNRIHDQSNVAKTVNTSTRVVPPKTALLSASTYSLFEQTGIVASTPSNRGTPPKKKGTSGRATYSPQKSKPRTPKRKIAAIHLVWNTDVTKAFMECCLSRKHCFQVDLTDIPISVWKDIREELLQSGHDIPWEHLRAKYNNMHAYFSKALANGGMTGGIPWSYFSSFCAIFDIDADEFECVNSSHELVQEELQSRTKWNKERERLLICLYADRKPKFDSCKCPIRHATLYNEIAMDMKMHDVQVSAKDCRAHMDSLLDQFRRAYDAANKTGGCAPEFPFYDEFLDMFKNSPILEAPVAISIGKGMTFSRNGVKETEPVQRTSRTRPSTSGGEPNKATKKGYAYKSAIVQEQPSRQDKLAQQVERMTDIFKNNSVEKLNLFRELVKNISELNKRTG
ncbi:Telomerase component p95 [Frankliniella fusca]|uniref:Telomerase component p95 n=1 Tax=Frankliniella fusca TaxID=407009 RepID=A0AAE1HWA1_9NEOP|nr:Telomerase component p95 [Frankliniella fusca]